MLPAAPAARGERLWVDAPDERAALALVEQMRGLHAELRPRENGCCEVAVELRGDRELVAVLDAAERWLIDNDIPAATVHLGARVYTLRRDPSIAPRTREVDPAA